MSDYVVFDNNNFNDKEVSYLEFNDDFKISLDNNFAVTVILGSNGIGKTSLCKNIISHQDIKNKVLLINYEDVKESIVKQRKNIKIAPKLTKIESLDYEIKNSIIEKGIKVRLKELGINKTTVKKSRKEFEKILNNDYSYLKSDYISEINDFNLNQFKFMFDNYDLFLESINKEELIEQMNSDVIHQVTEKLMSIDFKDSTVCPVCNTDLNNIKIIDVIKKRFDESKKIDLELMINYSDLFYEDYDSKISNIIKMKNVIDFINKNYSKSALYYIGIGYIRFGFDASELMKLKNNHFKYKNLVDKNIKFFDLLKENKDAIIDILSDALNVKDDDIKILDNLIKVSLDYELEKHSTGEVNYATFIIMLLEFIYSDKQFLIIDDPLSSYDTRNQYKIIKSLFDVNKNKKVLVFTHSMDTLNIMKSIGIGSKYFYIDKKNYKLHIDKLFFEKALLNVSNFKNNCYFDYIRLSLIKDVASEDEIHKLFHYSSKEYIYSDNPKLSNYKLLDIINKFDKNLLLDKNSNIYDIFSYKIICFIALRVYVEKFLYDNVSNNKKEELDKKKTLGEKIKSVYKDIDMLGKNNITKKYLNKLKIMVNMNEHSLSQVEPFYYAINLYSDDFINEIDKIKKDLV